MDTQITAWELNLEPDRLYEVSEGIANWPSEPYTLDRDEINLN